MSSLIRYVGYLLVVSTMLSLIAWSEDRTFAALGLGGERTCANKESCLESESARCWPYGLSRRNTPHTFRPISTLFTRKP
jgi:hypothetical protein